MSPDRDKWKDGETRSAGMDAFQMTHSVGPDRSSCRRSCASAWDASMTSRQHAPERERLEPRVQRGLRENLLHLRGSLRHLLEQLWPRSREWRLITIQFS